MVLQPIAYLFGKELPLG